MTTKQFELASRGSISVLALVLGVLSAGLTGISPAWAATTSLSSFVAKYSGQRVADPNGGNVGECVSLIKRYHTEVVGGENFAIPNHAASGMWTQFAQMRQLTAKYSQVAASSAARRGDIAVFSGGTFGHVVVVLTDAAASSTSLHVFEQNSPEGAAAKETPNKSKTNLLGYLRPSTTSPGDRIAVVLSNGNLLAKDGLSGAWVTETGNVKEAYLAGDRIGALLTNGTLIAKDGLSGAWVTETGNVVKAMFAGNRIAVVLSNGNLLAKDGLSGAWVTETGNVKEAYLAGDRIGALLTNGTLIAKDGLSGAWVTETGNVVKAMFN